MILEKIRNFDFKDVKFGCILAIISALIMAITAIAYTPAKTGTFIVKVDGKEIGCLNSLDNCELLVKSLRATDGEAVESKIKIKRIATKTDAYSEVDNLEQKIRRTLGLKQKAYVAYINGTVVAKVASREEIKKAIEGVEKYYLPQYGEFKVVSRSIKEKIDIKEEYVGRESKLDRIRNVISRLLRGKETTKTYAVKKGDTISAIAFNNDKSINELRRDNKGINLEKLKIGQLIKMTTKKPYLSMRIVVSGKSKEDIAFAKKFIPNKYLLKGITKVRIQGKKGLAEVSKNLVIENGDVVDEAIVKSVILKKPEVEILYSGIKQNMLLASGTFMKPSRGGITSVFGRRWGRNHEGIDIGASTGTPIVAADNGKVCFAGVKNGYGKCVIINHGKGIETLYGHTSKYIVSDGQYVKKGQLIAYVGSTGRSTGPHLHFEVRKSGEPVNPMKYMQ